LQRVTSLSIKNLQVISVALMPAARCPVIEHEVNIFVLRRFEMNVKHMVIGTAVFAATMSGCAQPNNRVDTAPSYSSGGANIVARKTRAQVRAEVDEAYRQGTLHPVGEEWAYPFGYPCQPQRAYAC
jgi:hypothetical protein